MRGRRKNERHYRFKTTHTFPEEQESENVTERPEGTLIHGEQLLLLEKKKNGL